MEVFAFVDWGGTLLSSEELSAAEARDCMAGAAFEES